MLNRGGEVNTINVNQGEKQPDSPPPIITIFFKVHLIILRENQAFNTLERAYKRGVRVPWGSPEVVMVYPVRLYDRRHLDP